MHAKNQVDTLNNQSHTGGKPYECNMCNKASNQKNIFVLDQKIYIYMNVHINVISLENNQ